MNIILGGIQPRLPDSVKLCEEVIPLAESELKVPEAVVNFGNQHKSNNYVSIFLLFLQIGNECFPLVFGPNPLNSFCWIMSDNSTGVFG